MHRIVLYFFCLGILSSLAIVTNVVSAKPAPSKITVLSSIKPVQMIVFAIAGDNINSEQLIPDYISPHDYSFKPSDIRKIKKADLIFRIDEHFETVLETSLKSVFKGKISASKVISLAENPKIKLLPVVGGHHHHEKNQEEGHEGHGNTDLHIFTSPYNAIVMAQNIADELIKADVKNTGLYQKNLQIFIKEITPISIGINSKLESVRDKPFIVFHHSWQYFGEYFKLQKPKVIDLHEGFSAGVKTLMNVRKAIASDNIHCVFSHSGISKKRIAALTEDLNVRSVEIDTMGRGLTLNKSSYIQWLRNMGEQVGRCLGYE